MKKTTALFFLLFLCTIQVEAQCAMCRAVLETEEGQTAAKGINNGIVYLMAIPYILVGGIALVIYYKFTKKKNEPQ